MKKINLFNKKSISKDIKLLKQKEPFTKLSDEEYIKILSIVSIYLLIFGVTVLFDMLYISVFMPFIGLTGINIYFIKEFVKLKKRNKAEKNMENIARTLGVNNIKTNANRLTDSKIKSYNTEETLSNCYLFLDKDNKINGLYEEINIPNRTIDYYTLNNDEVTMVTKGKRKVLTKTDTIIRR